MKTLITLFLNCCRVIPLLFLLAAEPLSANSFLPQTVPSDSGYYRVTLKPIEKPIPLGQLHPWQLIIKERESGKIIQPDSITLDGGMPAHGHGLPSAPVVGEFNSLQGQAVEGMFFNMAGLWQFYIEFRAGERNDSATIRVAVGHRVNVTGSTWSAAEKAVLKSLQLPLATKNVDMTSAVSDNTLAAVMGARLFFDPKLSRSGALSCSTCHQPDRYFTDGLARAQGLETLTRNTPTLVGTREQSWFYWDGRRDSLWSQALVPIEAAAEMNNSRTRVVSYIAEHYQREYTSLFGELPKLDFDRLPDATPLGNPEQQSAWTKINTQTRVTVNRMFSNIGKTIAAYEALLMPAAGRFDHFVAMVLNDDLEAANTVLSPSEQAGLKLFISNRSQCLNCHNSPLMTNHGFHAIGSAESESGDIDAGRLYGQQAVELSEFNCRSPYNDNPNAGCDTLDFASGHAHATEMFGAFKVPTLRGLSRSFPYMHDGRFNTLAEVVDFYADLPATETGQRTELPSIADFTAEEKQQLTDFLQTLGDDIDVGRDWLQPR